MIPFFILRFAMIVGGPLLAEHFAPSCPQIVLVEGSQLFDLSPDFGFLGLLHDMPRIVT